MNIYEAISRTSQDREDLDSWYEEEYQKNFGEYFEKQAKLQEKFSNQDANISDAELEDILVKLPIQLVEVSKVLNRYKLWVEALKIESKQKKSDDPEEKASQSLLIAAYGTIVSRVETQISYSRELIMGAKKIWDSRQSAIKVLPLSPENLPEYSGPTGKKPTDGKTYIT